MRDSFDIAVVGAGIVGAACALRLAREGLSVVVIDGSEPASGATGAAMGHIVAMDDSEAQFALTAYSQRLWNEIAGDLPAPTEYERCGTIWIAQDDEEMAEARRKCEFYRSHSVASEILDGKALIAAEPNLAEGLAGGLLVPGDSVVYQPFATRHFLDLALASGASLRIGKRAVSISDGVVGLEDGTGIAAGRVIVAGGCGSNDLVPGLGIRRKKGHLVITDRYPGFVSHQLVELGYLKSAHASESDSVAFNVQPRLTGQVLIGSSRQYDVADGDVDRAIVSKMLNRAQRYMPKIGGLSAIRIWTGSRPATADNLPVIGSHPRDPRLLIAAGHEGLGITTSLGTAEIIADSILGRESAIDAEPYSPARLSGLQ